MRVPLVILFLLCAWKALATDWPVCSQAIRTGCVVDGDTIRLGGERVRLMGFDTPELRGKCRNERRNARVASRRLAKLLGAGYPSFEWHGRDRYGRRLAFARVAGRDVSAILIAEGLARPYTGARRKSWC